MIRIMPWASIAEDEILSRSVRTENVQRTVSEIIANVRENGDAALKEYAKKFDRAEIDNLLVTEAEFEEAFSQVSDELLNVIRRAAKNIEAFHMNQKRTGFVMTAPGGVVLGQRVLPLEKVGLYIPNGTASYPSTVLMNAIPAKIAGCSEIIMVSPTGPDGKIAAPILAAAKIAGVTKVCKTGGAQAVAALAYGTESVPRVDKIVGPGNAYVAEAKRQVYGQVAIDMIAGPSEILIISDEKSGPACLAADLLSQAEHDTMASAVLVTTSEELAKQVQAEVEKQLSELPRCEIARASIENNGKILIVEDLKQALEASNRLAPEHLELCVEDPFALLDGVKNAGSVFLGRNCPESLGDYLAGPNHTLPTMGTARFSSPLSVDDFVKKTAFTYYTAEALKNVRDDIAVFARSEGLEAHARAALFRK